MVREPNGQEPMDPKMNGAMDDLPDIGSDQVLPALRIAKRRIALIAALADLAGVWPLEQVTGVLTDFAARASDLAARTELLRLIRRNKIPGLGEDDIETGAGLVAQAARTSKTPSTQPRAPITMTVFIYRP